MSRCIERINKSLGEYYKSVGKAHYFSNGIGLFLNYCEENELEDDHIIEELTFDASESILVDFDEDFPLKPSINDPNERFKAIFRIIKYCNDNGMAPVQNSQNNYSIYTIPQNENNFHIWNVRLHMDKNMNATLKHISGLLSLKGPKDQSMLVDGFIREIHSSMQKPKDITNLISKYYANDTAKPLLFRSLILCILFLLHDNCGIYNDFVYERPTTKRFEKKIKRIKERKERNDENYDDEEHEFIYERDASEYKMNGNKYDWIDIINENNAHANNATTTQFNVDIELSENDFDLNNMHKILKENEWILDHEITIEETMLCIDNCGIPTHELIGPFDEFDTLQSTQLKYVSLLNNLKKALVLFDNAKWYNLVNRWYCYRHSYIPSFYSNGESSRYPVENLTYFGLLQNSIHIETNITVENVLCCSFLVTKQTFDPYI